MFYVLALYPRVLGRRVHPRRHVAAAGNYDGEVSYRVRPLSGCCDVPWVAARHFPRQRRMAGIDVRPRGQAAGTKLRGVRLGLFCTFTTYTAVTTNESA